MTQIKKFTLAISKHGTIGIINVDQPIEKDGVTLWTGITLENNSYRKRKKGIQPHIIAYDIISEKQGSPWSSENPEIIGQLFGDYSPYNTVEQIPLEKTIEDLQSILNESDFQKYKQASEQCKESIQFFKEQCWG